MFGTFSQSSDRPGNETPAQSLEPEFAEECRMKPRSNRPPVGPAVWLALGISLTLTVPAVAQGFRPGGDGGRFGGGFTPPSPEDSFRRMDTNQNGELDPEEIQALPGFLRDMMSRNGIDGSRPVSMRDYLENAQRMREQFERSRSSGESQFQFRRPDGDGGGSPFGGFRFGGDSERREFRPSEAFGREDRDRDSDRSRDSDRNRDSSSSRSSSSSSSSKSSKTAPKPKVRITKELPESYRDKDKNGDGQIGLYEWDRQAFAQFFELDANGDGFLTPSELIRAVKSGGSSSRSSASSSTATNAATGLNTESRSPTVVASVPSSSSSTSGPTSAAKPTSASSSSDNSPAVRAFVGLDSNRDGKLSDEEWRRSRSARSKFEKAGVKITLPIDQAEFIKLYNKAEGQ